jgi:hypothetical protein
LKDDTCLSLDSHTSLNAIVRFDKISQVFLETLQGQSKFSSARRNEKLPSWLMKPFGKVTALQSIAHQVVANAQNRVLTVRTPGAIAIAFESVPTILAGLDASGRPRNIFG